MTHKVISVLTYFSHFSYPPTFQQLHRYYPYTISSAQLALELKDLVQKKTIEKIVVNGQTRYMLHNNFSVKTYAKRYTFSKKVLHESSYYLRYLALLQSIQYIGISGSLSMHNASTSSDIDVFIITSCKRLWITRFMVMIYKKLIALVKPDIGHKLCFNLFFAQNGLKLAKKKHTIYVGHELLQLQSVYNTNNAYEHLLISNNWIMKYFPNVHINLPSQQIFQSATPQSKIVDMFDNICKYMQVWWLKRKGYSYSEYNNQLWLIQKDFEDSLVW